MCERRKAIWAIKKNCSYVSFIPVGSHKERGRSLLRTNKDGGQVINRGKRAKFIDGDKIDS